MPRTAGLISRRRILVAVVAAVAVAAVVVRLWHSAPVTPAALVTLRASADTPEARNAEGQTIARVRLGGPQQPEVLVNGFASVAGLNVSYDGRRVLFAGRRQAGEASLIWEMPVAGSSPHAVLTDGQNFDPAYLPDGRLIYARSLLPPAHDSIALHVANADGSGQERITFGTSSDRSPALLPDGRIVFRRQMLGTEQPGRLFVVNPDGTGLQLFSTPAKDTSIEAGPWVIGDRVYFAEELPENAGQRLVSVSARQPLGTREIVSAAAPPAGTRFASVAGGLQDELLAASWTTAAGWGIGNLRSNGTSGSASFDSLHAMGLALTVPRVRPLSLTSVVNPQKSTGTLLCLDVRDSRLAPVSAATRGAIRTVRVLDVGGAVFGEAPVEPDGSFFVEVPANRPLHLEISGPNGTIAADHSGLWVRPNENRACIGCHEDPELAPDNRVVLAVGREPTQLGALAALNGGDR